MVRWSLLVLSCLTILPALAVAQAPRKRTVMLETPPSALLAPARSKDRAELSRVAMRIGPARLAQALSDADAEIRLAALLAVPLLPQAPLLLQYLPPRVRGGTPAEREQAIRSLADVLPALDVDRTLEWEVPREITREACLALLAAGNDGGLAIAPRVLAVATLGNSLPVCGTMDLTPLLSDKEAAVRRAAVLALTGPEDRVVPALRAATLDASPTVAAAASARWCREHRPGPAPAELWRRMALTKDTSPDDLVDIIPCLDSPAAEDKAALAALRSHAAPAVREAAQAVAKISAKSNGI